VHRQDMARKTSGKLPSGHFQKTLRHRIAQPPRIVGFRVGFQQRRQSRDDAAPHRIGRLRFSANQCRLFVIQVGHEPVETRLRAAVAVSRHLSFRRAAAEMHVSQPALSTSISELEQTLGLTLFDRTSRSVALTELGSTFIKRATRILEDVDRLLLDTSSQVQSRQGRVVISAVSSIAGRLMSRAILLCGQKYPALEVEIRDDVATQVLQSVRSGDVDFAFTVEPGRLEDDLLFEPCMEDPFFFVCHRGHRLAQRSAVTWAELENEHLIALSTTSGMHRIVQGELLRRRVHITKSTPVTYLSTVHGMLEAGFGVSILPSMALP